MRINQEQADNVSEESLNSKMNGIARPAKRARAESDRGRRSSKTRAGAVATTGNATSASAAGGDSAEVAVEYL